MLACTAALCTHCRGCVGRHNTRLNHGCLSPSFQRKTSMFWSDLRARGDRACICISAKHALYPKPISSCVSVVSVAVQGRSIGREPTHIRPALSHACVPKKAWVAGLGPTQQQPRQLQPRSPTTTTHPVKRQTAHHRPHTRTHARTQKARTNAGRLPRVCSKLA